MISTDILRVDFDPSVTGLAAEQGERAKNVLTGDTYWKNGTGDTDWILMPLVPSSGGAPADATYITQTPNASLSAEQALSTLATGILKSTTGTGVVSIAVAGTDYVAPATTITAGAGLTGGGDLSANRTLDVVAADATIQVNANSIQVGTVPVGQVSGAVPDTRTITAGAGLTGGGDLSANRTIDVAAADGTITVNADSIQVGTVQTANIALNAVTNARLAQMGPKTVKGNMGLGAADPSDVSMTDLTANLNVFTDLLQGLVPASGGGTANFIRADGTWATPPGTGVTSVSGTAPIASSGGTTPAISLNDNGVSNAKLRDSGALSVIGRSANSSGDPADISASAASGAVLRESGSTLGFGTVATAGIANDAVTFAKMQNIDTDRVLGRISGGAGDVEMLTVSDGVQLSGTGIILSNAGAGAATYGGSGISQITLNAKGQVTAVGTATYMTSRQVNLAYMFGAASATGFAASGWFITSNDEALVASAIEYPLGQARSTVIFEIVIYDNSLAGGTGNWTLYVTKNGTNTGASLGPFSSGTTGYQGTGIVSVGGSAGDVYGLRYEQSGVTATGTTISFTANLTFDT